MKRIPLSQGQVAIVDAQDFGYLSQFKWFALKAPRTFYAVRNAPMINGKRRGLIYMHRVILGLNSARVLVDHKDRNGLNNRRRNLRAASQSTNQANRPKPSWGKSSRFKGVVRAFDRFVSKIRVNGRTRHLG